LSANALKSDCGGDARLNLLGLSEPALEQFFEGLGEKPYRARQITRWVYQRGVLDFAAMTDLSLRLRKRLQFSASLGLPRVLHEQTAVDGTGKWLLDVGGGQAIETVFIPEPNRGTLCVSSQAGCALDCAFCATGRQGFNRNLSAAEILGQIVLVRRSLRSPRAITNVVFMGMGEPLANYRNVLSAARLLTSDRAFGLSRRRVTISTAGLVPQILRLAEECNVALAVSLHAPTDQLRDELVPINRRHPIGELLEACWRYARRLASRQVTFEYVMLDGVNDSLEQARQLAGLLENRPAKVNLIPFNGFPGAAFKCSAPATIERFWQFLIGAGIVATIRRPRGDDIAAACGQLAGRVRDRTRARLGTKRLGAA
jgi:23S rRNA (adenine2503-C2)-methyltransferase